MLFFKSFFKTLRNPVKECEKREKPVAFCDEKFDRIFPSVLLCAYVCGNIFTKRGIASDRTVGNGGAELHTQFLFAAWNPEITNTQIGKKMAKIFPATSLALPAMKIARHTRMLHKIPETNAFSGDKFTLPKATLIVNAPKPPLE